MLNKSEAVTKEYPFTMAMREEERTSMSTFNLANLLNKGEREREMERDGQGEREREAYKLFKIIRN